jgi:hypothetical protein
MAYTDTGPGNFLIEHSRLGAQDAHNDLKQMDTMNSSKEHESEEIMVI